MAAALEVDVRVLGGAALMRMLGVQAALAEGLHLVPVHQALDLGIAVLGIDGVDLLDLMAGAEAVEEVQERHGSLDGGQVRHQRHVGRLLHGVGGQHRKAGLAAGHDVAVIAKDVQRVIRQRARGDVEHARHQLAGDLVHVRDHQQQTLGSGERGGHRAGGQGAVHGARGARLRLHLGHADRLAEQVETPVGGPLVGHLGHGGRRGDRVNGGHVAECIRDMTDGGVAVNGKFDAQRNVPPFYFI